MKQMTKEESWNAVGDAVRYLKEHESPKGFISGTLDLIPTVKTPARTLEPDCMTHLEASFSSAALEEFYKAHASQSPVGKGNETMTDLEVRKSREVPGDQAMVGSLAGNWTRVIEERICRKVEEEMSPGTRVQADFYKLLVYGEGDFFKDHKDTQRSDDQFASLLVFLPTKYTGGDFLLHEVDDFDGEAFNKETQEALGRKQCRWIAFYSDAVHSVEPILSGYRLVLAYNLRRQGAGGRFKRDAPLARPLQRLVDGMREHFGSPQGDEPWVFQLQHKYTLSSMTPEHLKGIDSTVYQLLSQHFDCDIRLLSAYESEGGNPSFSVIDKTALEDLKKIASFCDGSEYDEYEELLGNLTYIDSGEFEPEEMFSFLTTPHENDDEHTRRFLNYVHRELREPASTRIYQLGPGCQESILGIEEARGYNAILRDPGNEGWVGNEGVSWRFQYISAALRVSARKGKE
ncbi:unnamed protein product [Vitrella brassicaformis CCMP3155]|uniref:Prolyl 4-hydroxylase alpha subunit Fe(2+) 2OG dioxygenase domain-containing protein n=1 Tax=Vitrella brassicaformis (strain CCMP3155) TaxID=1169540 RepID=A0A0G4GKG3_VITBC|nr:unnamed protein product [Vitrella brassicaformis CCMP3155]|eukprot:CEM30464.1 unnamed protein product [Vitrella brassicaformis CCMP3155]